MAAISHGTMLNNGRTDGQTDLTFSALCFTISYIFGVLWRHFLDTIRTNKQTKHKDFHIPSRANGKLAAAFIVPACCSSALISVAFSSSVDVKAKRF